MMPSRAVSRRRFLEAAVAFAGVPSLAAQVPGASLWDGPVLDIHLHLRQNVESNLSHIDGCGVTRAVLLANVAASDRAKEALTKYPARFVRFASIDVTKPDFIALLTQAVKEGALGFGEIKSQVEAAGREMQGLYAAAADLNVPITIHFQEVSQPGSPGKFNTGLKQFDAMLKKYPRTRFIGHADAFWANVSADYAEDTSYPKGRIKPGGVTDRFLGDYPNLFADMSANSGNNFLNRDPEFAAEFLLRHQDKLMFGSDCTCPDGSGAVRCIARETLTALKKLASPQVFRKITWENGQRIIGI
jgi:predicted TIM-barrel fold metal-dependent hydrolase